MLWQMKIEGMTCEHCVARVTRALGEVEGLEQIEVELEPGVARFISSAEDEGLSAQVTEVVEDAGYDVLGVSALDEGVAAEPAPEPASAPAVSSPRGDDTVQAPPAQPEQAREGEHDEVSLDVRGMTCASCVARVERSLGEVDDVESVVVNFATEVAKVRLKGAAQPSEATVQSLKDAVERAGYEVERVRLPRAFAQAQQSQAPDDEATSKADSISSRRAQEAELWRSRWMFGLGMTIPVMFVQMGPMWFELHPSGGLELGRLWLLAYLTLWTMLYTGRGFFEGAWAGLKHRSANMDTLVALGVGVSFVASVGLTIVASAKGGLGHTEVYYDGAVMILTLIAVGKWLEARAKGRAGQALEAIMGLGAKSARVKQGEQWVERPVSSIKVGELILVSAGEKIPVDGQIVEGQADVNEAMMTGESVPVRRVVGDEVLGASINTDGRLVVRATRVGDQTALAQIARQVEQAQGTKADIQRLADRVSSVFVPVILVIALGTFVVWWAVSGSVVSALLPAIAVLVVACPCALGLATPTAMMVGTAVSARQGIIIRDANALERARALDVIIFDKTGTLTTGQMKVGQVALSPGFSGDEAQLLSWALALEQGSAHPIAAAIMRYGQARGVEAQSVEAFKSHAGDGVTGRVQGQALALGKVDWVSSGRALDESLKAQVEAWRGLGQTVIAIGDEASVLGLIALSDELKEDAVEVVRALEAKSIEVWMVTGDDPKTAASIASGLGISQERVRAGVLPAHKAQIVREVRGQSRVVAMVGDGINDAPALAEADLGIALGTGADVAMEAADMTLVGESLALVLMAVEVATATYDKIRQNLFWAFIYNVILVPVAALGLLMPALAAGAMALSSVSVVSNSLLLGRRLKA